MLPVYTGFHNEKLGDMFPILFVTVACGAVSGFHSLVSSGTSCELLGHRMAEHPKFPLNTDHSISAPLRISPHYTIRIAQADPLQTIHLTVMP